MVKSSSCEIFNGTVQADQTHSSSWFNGDDAIVLMRGTTIVDCIGRVGEDPGTAWCKGEQTTLDRTLVGKPTVTEGDANTSDIYDPSQQWLSYPNAFD